jgi:signal transduction histidine kinase/ActR/RegA family two-component response regulator
VTKQGLKRVAARHAGHEVTAAGENGDRKAFASPEAGLLRELFDGLGIGVASVLPSGEILFCNPRFRELLGIPYWVPFSKLNLSSYVSSECWPDLARALLDAIGRPVEGEVRFKVADRTTFVSLSMTPVLSGAMHPICITAAEVTQLVETSKALTETETELKSLSAKVLKLADDERRRIARDLHDVTGQDLAALSMILGSVLNDAGRPQKALRQAISDAVDMLQKVENEVRTLSYLLHPPLLDELGLAAALKWYVDGFRKRTGLAVTVDTADDLPRLHRDREIALFRVVQEALTNVIRHAEASRVAIRAVAKNDQLVLTIEDNGTGVPSQKRAALSKGRGAGVGIAGMSQRLQQLGGSLEVVFQPSGTVVFASVPVQERRAEGDPEIQNEAETTDTDSERKRVGQFYRQGQIPPAPSTAERTTRILVADDHEITRRGIRELLREHPDLEICAEVSNGFDAVVFAEQLRPDLLILDIQMPQTGGISAAHRIKRAGLPCKIIIFTTHAYPGLTRLVRASGSEGYVLKQNASSELVKAIRTVLSGSAHFPAVPDEKT